MPELKYMSFFTRMVVFCFLIVVVYLPRIEAGCPDGLPDQTSSNGIPPRYIPIDNCQSEDECKQANKGTMCCTYCGDGGCNNYCRGCNSAADLIWNGGIQPDELLCSGDSGDSDGEPWWLKSIDVLGHAGDIWGF
jgi:hypothetical protein